MNKKLRVLLVEDHEADRRLVEEALNDCHIQVDLDCASDGVEAIKFVKELACQNTSEKPDLIILDLNMPRKGGHEFLEEMHEYLRDEEIPVVLLTVSDSPEDVNRAMDKHMNFFLSKPVNAEKLQQVLTAINDLWAPAACCS